MKLKKINIKKSIINLIMVIIGTMIMAIGVDLFLVPNQLSSGGFSGIGTIIYYLFHIPVGTTVIILNIPLFIIAYIKLGKEFLLNSILGTVLLGLFLNFFEKFNAITTDRFLAFLYGSIIDGIGTAIILKAGSSTGGSDLLASIANAYNSKLRPGKVIVLFDAIVIIANTIFFKEIEIALYSALVIYVMGKILDIFFEGINFGKMMLIISPKWEEISKRLGNEIERGVTAIYGAGMYKKEEKKILLCVMSRNEINDARNIIKQEDPNAFIIITNAREVFGEGFKES